MPHFVLAGIKVESLTGFLRSLDKPAVRIQDGFKQELLCDRCEQLFSNWESILAKEIFAPLTQDPDATIRYGATFSRFALSVLWRVLVWRSNTFLAVSPEFKGHIETVEREWRQFLLGEAMKPGRASCHAVIFAQKLVLGVGAPAQATSDGFQRYFQSTVDVNVISDGRQPFVYAKLGRLLIFGFVPEGTGYRNSRVALRSSTLGPGAYQLPPAIFGTLLHNAANIFAAIKSLSPRQKQRIDDSIARTLQGRRGSLAGK
ncbi:MAG: hypothetical protein HY661_18275 [Betaproteobacteria bacterium]|nr:hypothetical protein [Betaproteobacteria bacterium]